MRAGWTFFSVFFEMEKDPVGGVFFHVVWSFFMDVWSLEVTFGEILVSLGRLWTCLVPGGSREATLSKYTAPLVHLLLHLGDILGVKW